MNDKVIQPSWKTWEGVLGIISIFFLMTAIGLVLDIFVELDEIEPLKFAFISSLTQTFLMISLPIAIVAAKYGQSWRDLGFVKDGFLAAVPQGIKWGGGLFVAVMVLGIFSSVFYPREPELQDFAKILLLADSSGEFFLAFIMGVVLAPLGEEIYFRGFLYPALRQRFGVKIGIILTAVLFSFLHFDFYRFIPIGVGGLGLTYLYEKSGNIWTTIIAHGVWNGIMIILIFISPTGIS